jgi:hypothetical protein
MEVWKLIQEVIENLGEGWEVDADLHQVLAVK